MKYVDKSKAVSELNEKIRAYRPLKKALLSQVKEYYRIGLTYSSNALEGNTLTETETKVVLEDGLTIAGKPLKDHYEATGHSEAFDAMYALSKNKNIVEEDVLTLHRLFYYRINKKLAGTYRKVPVIITGTDYVPPTAKNIPLLMKDYIKEMTSLRKKLSPIELAAHFHRGLVDIHPFVDGNGRTARLLMNLVLLQSGYVITLIPPVLRAEYIACIRKSQTGKKDASDFIRLISMCCYESTKSYLKLLSQLHEN